MSINQLCVSCILLIDKRPSFLFRSLRPVDFLYISSFSDRYVIAGADLDRKIFEKTVKKAVFGHFLKIFKILTKKSSFFWRALPLKVSIYWRQRRL